MDPKIFFILGGRSQDNTTRRRLLATKSEFADDRVILVDIAMTQIIEKLPTTRDQLEQALARIIILLVYLEMLRQLVDALRKQCDLHLRRTRVRSMRFVVGDYLLFKFCACCHSYQLLL